MGMKIDRTGEENINRFGSKMTIIRSNGNKDIDIYFPEYNWISKNKCYGDFKIGNIKCPYEPRTLGHGYIGEGKYNTNENGENTKCYQTWHGMLERCYSEKTYKKQPTYKGCKVSDEWLCFQNFAKWYYENIYFIEGERMALDKDILYKGNKIYSRNTCIFVPERINTLFVKQQNQRGELPIGVYKFRKKYATDCRGNGEHIHLGIYNTPEEAFQVYKSYKEKIIKQTIDSYECVIPEPHYSRLREAMYNYEVEMYD